MVSVYMLQTILFLFSRATSLFHIALQHFVALCGIFLIIKPQELLVFCHLPKKMVMNIFSHRLVNKYISFRPFP